MKKFSATAISDNLENLREARNMGEVISILNSVKTKQEAKIMWEAYVVLVQETNDDDCDAAMDIADENIGFMTGYMDTDDAKRVCDLYDVIHPVYGLSHTDESFNPSGNSFEINDDLNKNFFQVTKSINR